MTTKAKKPTELAPVTKTLWEISDEMRRIGYRLQEVGELTPELEAELDAVSNSFAGKLVQCREYRATLEHLAAANKAEADRLAERAKALENAAESLRDYMARQIRAAGLESFELPDGSMRWSVYNSKGATVVDDAAALPSSCFIPQDPKIDLKKVRELYDRGLIFDGVRVVSKLVLKES